MLIYLSLPMYDMIWLGHINFNLPKFMNLNLLSNFLINPNHKCEIWVQAKLAKTPFYSIRRKTKPIELVHHDIHDLKFIQTRAKKNISSITSLMIAQDSVEAKLAKTSFHSIKTKTKPIELVHRDIHDLKFMQTRVRKNIPLLHWWLHKI